MGELTQRQYIALRKFLKLPVRRADVNHCLQVVLLFDSRAILVSVLVSGLVPRVGCARVTVLLLHVLSVQAVANALPCTFHPSWGAYFPDWVVAANLYSDVLRRRNFFDDSRPELWTIYVDSTGFVLLLACFFLHARRC